MTVFLTRVRDKLPIRAVEWLLSIMILTIGVVMLFGKDMFNRSGMSGFTQLMPALYWSTITVLIGGSRVAALLVNGHRPKLSSPLRALGAVLGVSIFAAFSAATSLEGGLLGPTVFIVLMFGDMYSSVRAGRDALDSVMETR